MRTFKMIIDPTKNKKNAAFCQYFKTNTTDSKSGVRTFQIPVFLLVGRQIPQIPNVCIILPIFISVIQ